MRGYRTSSRFLTVNPGAITIMFFQNLLSLGYATLFSTCQAINIPITRVFPVPVAIFEHTLGKEPPSEGISIPCLSLSCDSFNHIKVHIGSKAGRRKICCPFYHCHSNILTISWLRPSFQDILWLPNLLLFS